MVIDAAEWEPSYGLTATNTTANAKLAETLEAMRRRACAYGSDAERCDCKYGLRPDGRRRPGDEQCGCPELRETIHRLLHRPESLIPEGFVVLPEAIHAEIERLRQAAGQRALTPDDLGAVTRIRVGWGTRFAELLDVGDWLEADDIVDVCTVFEELLKEMAPVLALELTDRENEVERLREENRKLRDYLGQHTADVTVATVPDELVVPRGVMPTDDFNCAEPVGPSNLHVLVVETNDPDVSTEGVAELARTAMETLEHPGVHDIVHIAAWGRATAATDGGIGLLPTIWLHTNWRAVTRHLTTAQREQWSDAVDRSEPCPGPKADRWWRDDSFISPSAPIGAGDDA